MRIFVEESWLDNPTGIGNYSRELTRALLALPSDIRYSVFSFARRGGEAGPRAIPGTPHLRARGVSKRLYRFLFKRLAAPPLDLLLSGRPDGFLFTDFVRFPVRPPARSAVVVYDLAFHHHPQYVDPGTRKYLARFVPQSLARADHIFTISHHARSELRQAYGVAENKISVAYPGVDRARFHPRPPEEITEARARLRLPPRYLLFTGTLEPRKNVSGLLEAYAALPASLRRHYPLVLAGGKGWLDEDIQRQIRKAGGDNVYPLGFVAPNDLPLLYAAARAFIYPSFYEGFGLPPLEAMACGTPCIVSRRASLPEVVGEAGLLVDPEDSQSIAEAIAAVTEDDGLHRTLSERGLSRAGNFRWEDTAAQVHRVLSDWQRE